MRDMIEEYGYTILQGVVMAILILIALIVGPKVVDRTKEIIYDKTHVVQEGQMNISNSNSTIQIVVNDVKGLDIQVPVRVPGEYVISYSIKHDGLWSPWVAVEKFKTNKKDVFELTKTYDEIKGYGCGKGDYIKFQVSSNQTETDSNIIEFGN